MSRVSSERYEAKWQMKQRFDIAESEFEPSAVDLCIQPHYQLG